MSASVRCDEVHAAISGLVVCDETTSGARVATHCLYPSFDMVRVSVAKMGDGFKVHDDGGAFREAWLHGRDEPLIMRTLKQEAEKFRLKISDTSLVADVPSSDWLLSAILTVSNASSIAARRAVERITTAAEAALVDRISGVLLERFGKSHVKAGLDVRGASGGVRHFDFGVTSPDGVELLINGVLPHHGSVSSKYVAFADTDIERRRKLAVFDKSLETADIALLQQVADIVPFRALTHTALKALSNAN